MKIQAYSLQEAYMKASNELSISAADINIQIISKPCAGIFGLFKKLGVFEATIAKKSNPQTKAEKHKNNKELKSQKASENNPKEALTQNEAKILNTQDKSQILNTQTQAQILNAKPEEPTAQKPSSFNAYNDIIDNFNTESKEKAKATQEIALSVQNDLTRLFGVSSFKINPPEVSIYDQNTLYIKIDGEDSALLIGKEGYRYKAISYLLYNWINAKYGLNIRFEVAEFLSNQENIISTYLASLTQRIKEQGFGNTKVLDGVLLKIALEQLRTQFPDKYVAIKNNDEGRYIVVSEFYKK